MSWYLIDSQDLSVGSLELVETLHVPPEAGLSNDGVGGEHSHGEHLWVGVLLGGVTTSGYKILSHLHLGGWLRTFICNEASCGS
jgi:hypothetical protein